MGVHWNVSIIGYACIKLMYRGLIVYVCFLEGATVQDLPKAGISNAKALDTKITSQELMRGEAVGKSPVNLGGQGGCADCS